MRRKLDEKRNFSEPLRLGGGIRPEAPHNGVTFPEIPLTRNIEAKRCAHVSRATASMLRHGLSFDVANISRQNAFSTKARSLHNCSKTTYNVSNRHCADDAANALNAQVDFSIKAKYEERTSRQSLRRKTVQNSLGFNKVDGQHSSCKAALDHNSPEVMPIVNMHAPRQQAGVRLKRLKNVALRQPPTCGQAIIDAWNPCLDAHVCGYAPDRREDVFKGLESTTAARKPQHHCLDSAICLPGVRQDQRHQRQEPG